MSASVTRTNTRPSTTPTAVRATPQAHGYCAPCSCGLAAAPGGGSGASGCSAPAPSRTSPTDAATIMPHATALLAAESAGGRREAKRKGTTPRPVQAAVIQPNHNTSSALCHCTPELDSGGTSATVPSSAPRTKGPGAGSSGAAAAMRAAATAVTTSALSTATRPARLEGRERKSELRRGGLPWACASASAAGPATAMGAAARRRCLVELALIRHGCGGSSCPAERSRPRMQAPVSAEHPRLGPALAGRARRGGIRKAAVRSGMPPAERPGRGCNAWPLEPGARWHDSGRRGP
mmetsp:Transcript_482/g.1816  ORF Transcript_482/g.1816 Transcript_482/m.1816 type:complete len:293 (+) Transcript_482:956-1834(+)